MNWRYIVIAIELMIIYLLLVRSNKIELFTNGEGLNSFDRYYYLNLKSRKDRKKQILNEMKKIGLPKEKIERIDAVNEKYNGHLGCVKSHIKALENAKENNYDTVVVFEDDFIFTKDKDTIDNKLNEFLEKKKNKWDVVQMGASYTNTDNTDIEDIKNVNSAMTSSGYIINNNFYDTLLSNFYESRDKLQKMTDLHLQTSKTKIHAPGKIALDQYWQPLQEKSNWYLYDIGTQGGDAGESSIMGDLESNNENHVTEKKFPKIIHQIWIGDELPDNKKLFMESYKKKLDNTWEHKLWGNKDITKKNFPITYNYIQKIKKNKIKNNYNPYAGMADLMRYEIMYQYGGFYFDSNIELLKDLAPIVDSNYDIIVCHEETKISNYLSNGFFASKSKSKYLKNLLSKKNLDNIKYGSIYSNVETGPYFFIKAFNNINNNKKIKILPTKYIYPVSPGDNNESRLDKCVDYDNNKPIYPCEKYKDSYAIDHFNFGLSYIT